MITHFVVVFINVLRDSMDPFNIEMLIYHLWEYIWNNFFGELSSKLFFFLTFLPVRTSVIHLIFSLPLSQLSILLLFFSLFQYLLIMKHEVL